MTAVARRALPDSAFAGPGRSYPINNASHARNALARAAQHATPDLKASIRAKVHKKFPSIKIDGESPKSRMDRAPRK